MLDRLGIRSRVLLLALLPAGLMALVLGSYFTWLQQNDLRTQLLQRGKMIAEQLAPLAAPAMARLAPAQLERIAAQTLEQSDVRAVAFLAPDRTRLAHAGPSMLNQPPSGGTGTQLLQRSGNDATRYLMPVFGHHRDLATDAVPAEAERLLGWVEIELSHDGTLLRGYRNLFTSLLLILACLVLSGLLALRMSRTINDPIERIKHAVNQLKDGHLEERLPTMGSHELDELARGINRMAETLQNAHEELQHSIDQATEDVRQNLETIEIQNIELDMARKEALEASRIKSEFLANMSHEIRTPLNGILGFTHLLQKSEMTPRQLDYLSTIEKSADNLLGIINEILDFSKIEAGKLVLDSIPFNLRDLIQDTLTILAPAAHAKQLELLSLIYRDTPSSLIGDPLRLKQILTNLVSNAIKFTREGTIVVRAMLDDEHEDFAQLRISVQDTGIGLSPQDVRTLFQAFSQADNSLARQPGGTGLGLVISKRLIEQMGGEIGVDSTPGEGSQFWISLNLPKAHDDIEELPLQPLLGRRAAIVDGHELARQALEHQLEDCGLSVSLFTSYEQLLQAVQAASQAGQPFEFAVLGANLGNLSPEQLGHYHQQLERYHCQCVVLCPTTEQALYHPYLPNGHGQLLSKPTCTRKLRRLLLELLQPRRPQGEVNKVNGQRQPKVLCVDDNAANLLLVQTLLEDLGAEVLAVDNGYAAVKAVQDEPFDLVLMDVQMPGMDGRACTEQIRLWENTQSGNPLPIVALTAHAMANEKRALLHGGMDDYLTKPISERQLAQVVLKWTGLSLGMPQQGQAEQPPNSDELKVLDHEEGLRLAAGKADLAADMLSMLLASLDADREAIRAAREAEDHNGLIEQVHRLNGASRYCGVPQLRAACQRSETLLKQESPQAQQALDELDAAINRLAAQARLSAWVGSGARAAPDPTGSGQQKTCTTKETITMRALLFSSQHYDQESFSEAARGSRLDLHFQPARLTLDTAALADGYEVVCAFINDELDAQVLQRLATGGTRLIALRSAGYNHVDLAAAKRLGLAVVRVPAYSPHAVAEHAVALILALNRRLHRAYNRTREGDFTLHGLTGFDLHGKTVGVVGTGQIGLAFARIMAGFGCQLLAYDPYPNPELLALGARYLPLPELLREARIISLHCPLDEHSRHLINAQSLAQLQPGAMLINTGRGALVDTPALIDALKSGQLGYLGLDVYEEEAQLFFEDRSDLPLQDDVLARLLTFPNVIITAHQAFLTREALDAIAATTLENINRWAAGNPQNLVMG